MKKMLLVLSAVLSAVAGCASHHQMTPLSGLFEHSGLINDPRQVGRLEKSMTDKEIANLLDADVRAKLPTTLAVAKFKSHCSGYQPYLATIDAEELGAWEKAVAKQKLVRGVQPISALATGSESVSLHSLRVAAARMNCELLLVYLQADGYVDNFNDAAALYWTVVGLWVVPGNRLEHRTVMQAILMDSRTGAILGTATGDARLHRICPAAFKDIPRAKLAREAPAKALVDLQSAAGAMVTRVADVAGN